MKPILSLLLSPFCLPDVTVPVGVSLSRCIPKRGAPDVIKNTYEACQSPGEVFIRLKLDFKLPIIEKTCIKLPLQLLTNSKKIQLDLKLVQKLTRIQAY